MGNDIWLAGYTPSEDGNHLWLEVIYTGPIANDDLLTIEASVEDLFQEWFRQWIDHASPTDNDINVTRTVREQLAMSPVVQDTLIRNAVLVTAGQISFDIEPRFLVFQITVGSISKRIGVALSAILLFAGGVATDAGKDLAKEAVKYEICRAHIPLWDGFDIFIRDLDDKCRGGALTDLTPQQRTRLVSLCGRVAAMPSGGLVTIRTTQPAGQSLTLTQAQAVALLGNMCVDDVKTRFKP
nr:hypothetical protein [uncultured Rhodopila sp.]